MTQALPFLHVVQLSELSLVEIDGCALFKVLEPGNPYRPAGDWCEDEPLVEIELLSGRLKLASYREHEEGFERTTFTVKRQDNEDGSPARWAVVDVTRGRDCDGSHGRTWVGLSLGGKRDGGWSSPMEESDVSVYDGSARAAGY